MTSDLFKDGFKPEDFDLHATGSFYLNPIDCAYYANRILKQAIEGAMSVYSHELYKDFHWENSPKEFYGPAGIAGSTHRARLICVEEIK